MSDDKEIIADSSPEMDFSESVFRVPCRMQLAGQHVVSLLVTTHQMILRLPDTLALCVWTLVICRKSLLRTMDFSPTTILRPRCSR